MGISCLINYSIMIESNLTPIHALPSGLCEDPSGEAAALIERMAKGDGGALAELHEMWSPALLGISCRMLGERKEAEQVLQDAFVRIWHRSGEFDPHRTPPFVWAFAIVRDYCIDHLRFGNHGNQDHSHVVPIDLHPPVPATEDPRIMAVSDWHRIRTALDQLGPEEQTGLESAIHLEYTRSETSGAPGLPSTTVKPRLRKALEKIRNQLSRYEL